jgi:hypothetical protein
MYAFTFLPLIGWYFINQVSATRTNADAIAFFPTVFLDYSQLSPASRTAFNATMNVTGLATQIPQSRTSGPSIIVSSRDDFLRSNRLANNLLLTVTAFDSRFQYTLTTRDSTGNQSIYSVVV